MRKLPSRLLVVTDRHQAVRPLDQVVAAAVDAGARWYWLRDNDLAPDERRRVAEDLRAITRRHGAALSIGRDIELAAAIEADGVHLQSPAFVAEARRRLGRREVIGISAHTLCEVEEAAAAGADYVTLSPIYGTASKPGYGPPLGPEILQQSATYGIPVLALGGVTAERIAECSDFGAAGAAIMGPVMRAARPGEIVEDLLLRLARDVTLAPL
jgi:thiamine-phosphate pyrophosphorylase